jgi:serine O-acetyltransferase
MKSSNEPIDVTKIRLAEELFRLNSSYSTALPSVKDTQRWVREMVNVLFPIRENNFLTVEEIDRRLENLKSRLSELLKPMGKDLSKLPEEITDMFFAQLHEVYNLLLGDSRVFVKSDPAAEKLEEVILCYPGFFSLVVYRIAHLLYNLQVPLLPRVMTEYAHGKTGIDIHPGAVIGKYCFIDHGTGIVIGETTVVGDNVKIYQGVTLGALFVTKNLSNTKRHPTIEDNVILYSGSTILGGNTIVGHDTIVGGNVWLTESVLPYSIVYRDNKIVVRDKSVPESIHFVI